MTISGPWPPVWKAAATRLNSQSPLLTATTKKTESGATDFFGDRVLNAHNNWTITKLGETDENCYKIDDWNGDVSSGVDGGICR
jgi:hypothetical protein